MTEDQFVKGVREVAIASGSASDGRREAILDAAFSLFAGRGYRQTSVAAVAAAVGITDAGVLYHFKSKEQLLVAVLEHVDQMGESLLGVSTLQGIDLLRSVRGWGHAMEAVPEVQSMHVVHSAEQMHSEGPARAYFERRYERSLTRFREAFEVAAAAGDLRANLDAAHEASALLALLDGIRLQWFYLGGAVSMAVGVEAFVDAMLERLAPAGLAG